MTKDADCSRRSERHTGLHKLGVNKARCWPIFDDEEVSMQIAVKRTNVDLLLIFAALCIFSMLGKEHRCNSSRRIYAHQLVE